jgi:amino acid transporter
VFFVMSAAAPLTVVAGVVPTGIAVTGLTGISIAFVAVAVVLAIFAVGYVAMARHIPNAGAFYAYISQGIGRPVGVGASWVALVAYNMFQCASYGGFGAIASPLFKDWFGWDVKWWVLALICWALVAVLGVRDVAVNGKVLATLLVAEIILVAVFSFSDLFSNNFHASSAPINPHSLVVSGSGALLAMAITGFVGFEQSVVFSEESRDPRRTVPRATYIAIALIAVLYGFAAWAMISASGGNVVDRATKEGPNLFFDVASDRLGSAALHFGPALFLTSLIAAMISFHNIIARYTFSLGREGVLPRAFGRTVPGTGAPKNGSIAQSVVGLIVIVIYAVAGWDPLVQLFFYGGTGGGIGVLLLITLTSIAVIGYFIRHPEGEDFWHRIGAPVIGTILLLIMSYLTLNNIATLFGVAPGSKPTWVVPTAFAVVTVAGILWALVLRSSQPSVYSGIGLGARSNASSGGFSAALSGSEDR